MAKAKDPAPEPQQPTTHGRRKSTAGTIDLLVETRRRASDEYARAQRAEKAYRARKNATIARTTLRETKTHFAEGFAHLAMGFKGLAAVTRAVPYLLSERREAWRKKKEAKKRLRAEEMKNRIEEKLARGYADGEDGDGEEKEKEIEEGKKSGSAGMKLMCDFLCFVGVWG
ncbi:hypothetical protein GGR51DRAFT_555188 [Nemania sp. FL0031]|nr:hypothetical protein GGR51DRAFT_555188 [Nemania sp. FL0031]